MLVSGNARLTADPELRITPAGKAVATLRLVYNRGWGDNKKAVYFDGTAWGKTAEFASAHFAKGDIMYVVGELDLDTWDDRATGQKRSKHKVTIDRIQFAGGNNKKREEESPAKEDFGPPPASRPNAATQDDDEIPW